MFIVFILQDFNKSQKLIIILDYYISAIQFIIFNIIIFLNRNIKRMKNNKQKQSKEQVVHPTVFSISIFQSHEQFIALYLALQNNQHTFQAAKYLQRIIQRTKSPPISFIYTKQFLLCKTQSQVQLCIIRFISQLSDLAQGGKSMQSSLSYIIQNSSFLTQLRHNLTHRVMVKGMVIERGRQMILDQLIQKYWKVMYEKIWQTYFIDEQKVQSNYQKICASSPENKQKIPYKQFQQQARQQAVKQGIKKSRAYESFRANLNHQNSHKLSCQYLFQKCNSNYQFKNLIHGYILKRVLPSIVQSCFTEYSQQLTPQIKITNQIFCNYIQFRVLNSSKYFATRTLILLSTLLEIILSLHRYELNMVSIKYRNILAQIISYLVKQINSAQNKTIDSSKFHNHVYSSQIIIKKLRQIYLLKCIKQFNQVINSLPEKVFDQIEQYYSRKEQISGKKVLIF